MTDPETARPSRGAAALRWLLVVAIAVGGAYVVRRVTLGVRARAANRVVATDFARFEGCLFAGAVPAVNEVEPRAVALATGTGDPLWPHSCAPPLTRLAHAADDVAAEDPGARALAAAVRAMENALGEAVIWTGHVQSGRREPARWARAYHALRREVAAFVARRGGAMLPPEPPRHPRVPRAETDGPAAPRAVALPGGEEADIVDARATGSEFALLLRDRRGRYTTCRLPASGERAEIACAPLAVSAMADPRHAAFVPSERGAFVAMWARAPYSARGIVDLATGDVVLAARGNPDAARDVWASARNVMALQVEARGPEVAVAFAGATRPVPLPSVVDALASDRVLVGAPGGAAVVFADARARGRVALRAVPLGLDADPPGAVRDLATFPSPDLAAADRVVVACAVPAARAYVVAADAARGHVFVTTDGARFDRAPELPAGLDAHARLACDATGLAVARLEPPALSFARVDGGPVQLAEVPSRALRVVDCDAARCAGPITLDYAGDPGLARAGGRLLVADAGGPDRTPRVRAVDVAASRSEPVPLPRDAPTGARTVRVLARDQRVALFVAAAQTYAFHSRDAGRSFEPAVVAR